MGRAELLGHRDVREGSARRCVLLGDSLSLADFHDIAREKALIAIEPAIFGRFMRTAAEDAARASRVDETPHIMRTGSHLAADTARAAVLARLVAVTRAPAGISPSVPAALVAALNGAGEPATRLARLSGLTGGEACVLRGHAALACLDGWRALAWALALSAAHAEVQGASLAAWAPGLGDNRPQPGFIAVLNKLTDLTAGSYRVGQGGWSSPSHEWAPQLLGAAADVLGFAERTITLDLNSSTAGPAPQGDIGQHISLAMDSVSNALAGVATLCQRQLEDMNTLAEGGPAPAGLQAPALAGMLLARLRDASQPRPLRLPRAGETLVKADDGRRWGDLVNALNRLMALQALALAAAMEHAGINDGFSPAALVLYSQIRETPRPGADHPVGVAIEALADRLRAEEPGAEWGEASAAS